MKEYFKIGLKDFGRSIIVNFMCLIIVISMSVLASAAFSEDIGYIAYGTKEDSEQSEQLYTYYYEDGEDTKLSEYEAQGYTVTKSDLSEITKTGDTVFLVTVQIFTLLLLVSFLYPEFWNYGTKDNNLVNFKHKEADLYKGLKCGAVSIIPYALLLLFFLFTKNTVCASFPTALLKFINPSVYTFTQLIVGTPTVLSKLAVWRILLLFALLLVTPIAAQIGYTLGYKNISISEKLIYKKKK
ncbi:MAG: hypothetical protein IKD04_07355 [Clostridia bacterium]|nr:hypothetical protein [Clostridia bacterium]